MARIKIIIADDHTLFVDGIRVLLESYSNLEIVGVANDGKELLDLLRSNTPDIILMDINMPRLNGLEAARKINTQYKDINIVILSTYNDQHLIQRAIEYGAKGYLLKDIAKEELIKCITSVACNLTHFPKRTKKSQSTEFEHEDSFVKTFQLTKRELEVLGLIKQGHTNNEMANMLYLSVYTIETHRKNIMQKLGLKTPGALFKFIMENNL